MPGVDLVGGVRRNPTDDRAAWTKMKIARIDFDQASRGWTLWAYDRNERSLFYPELEPNVSLDAVIQEIDEDPTCIFWG